MKYDTAKLRQFINEHFGPQDLNDLLFDYFRSVHEDVTPGMTKRQQISLLLEFCRQHNQMENLLVAVGKMRPFFQPDDYVQGQKAPTAAPLTPTPITRNPRQIFISHAHQDAEVAQRLAHDLEAHGYDIWIAPDSIRPGEKWVEAINRGLEESGIFVLLLSPDAVASRWVQLETNVAITYTHEDEMKLYPLMLKTCRVPALWRAFQHISLRSDYALGYEQLLTALDQNYREIFNDPQTLEHIHEHLNPVHETTQEDTPLPINKMKDTQKKLLGTVSVETLGGVATPLIYWNELLPAEYTQTFSTVEDNQSQVEIHLVYGENSMAAENVSLGKFIIDQIAPAPRGFPQIKLIVHVDTDLILTVKAVDKATGKSNHLGTVDLKDIQLPETINPLPHKSDREENNSDTSFGSIPNIFEELFGRQFGKDRQNDKRKTSEQGKDLRADLTISFEEALFGAEKQVIIRRPEICSVCHGNGARPGTSQITCTTCNGSGEVRRVQQSILGSFVNVTACSTCQGSGELIPEPCENCKGKKQVMEVRKLKVKVPPGVDSDTQIRLTGEGAPGQNGSRPGNLYIVLSVQEHEFLVREGKNLCIELPLKVEQAKNGGKIEVPTAYGWTTLIIPPNTKHRNKLILSGKGVKDLHHPMANPGDQIVEIIVTDPNALAEKDKHMFDITNKSYRRGKY